MIDIEVQNLKMRYPQEGKEDLEVIDDLTFSVERGSLVAVIGPSGCGKSTLLRIVSGAEKPTSGTAVIAPDRRTHSASIEQSTALFPWRTAFQNAHVGVEVKGERLSKRRPVQKIDYVAANKRIQETFESFDLQGFEDAFPDKLSGGMQQRVAIIRALESEPRILFCDEPFSAIDFVTRLSLNTKFKKMSRNLSCTTLFVTHNIEEAIFLADRILVLSRRPCRIVDELKPILSLYPEDAVKCRKSPEFQVFFDRIWEKLKP